MIGHSSKALKSTDTENHGQRISTVYFYALYSMSIPRNKTPFSEAIVFIVGGGNYIEYQNLMDYSKRHSGGKKLLYGASEVMNASQFLKQLAHIAQDSS